MRITAKLAYSQLKINRSRTLWALIGIALSTALITAVCSFVASANSMLVGTLGGDYGAYGQSYMGILLIPAIFFGVIIVAMSVVVVSNVFRVSANERTAQFGILKSIGATKKQIMTTVMYESIWVCAIGIPIGIVMGLLLAFGGVSVANHYLDELNSLVHIMMNEITWTVNFVVSWQALLAAASISFLTVLFSAWLPANKAAKVTAIDGIRGTGEVKLEAKQLETGPLLQKFFGFEGTLAAKNMKRNRRVFRATVISLTVGVILFINLSALGGQANSFEAMMQIDVDATILSEYSSDYQRNTNEQTGREETVYTAPTDSEVGNTVTEKLREFENTKTFGLGYDLKTYTAVIPHEQISAQMLSALDYPEEQQSYELPVEINVVDAKNYAALCKQAGVPTGSNILLNHYSYNDNGKEVNLAPFLLEGETLQLTKADGSLNEMRVHGVLNQDEMPKEFFTPNSGMVRLVVPQAQVSAYSCYSDPSDMAGFMDYANTVMSDMFPNDENAGYMEIGFNTRVYKINDYMRVMNMAIVVALIFMYSFVVLLMLIGLTNVISTMSANVLMRSREFAVLQSVGMTPEVLKRMLTLESILCSTKALVFGLPVAIILTYLINLPIKKRFPIPYEIPWLAMLLCVCAVLLITLVTTRCAAYRLRNRNIIEAIRSESGR